MTPTDTGFFGPEYWENSHKIAAAARREAAVHRVTLPSGVTAYLVVRYEDARNALTDSRLSKDAAGLMEIMQRKLTEVGQPKGLSGMFSPHMLFADGDEHKRLRGLVAAKFTRARIRSLQPRVVQIADALLDALPLDGQVDLIKNLAVPFPLTVICELLGVPEHDRHQLQVWSAAMMDEVPANTTDPSKAMADYLRSLIAAKRVDPGDDLLSDLVSAEGDDRLSADELMGTAFLLVVAGHETTTSGIGNTVSAVLQRPDLWRMLGQHPEKVPSVVEEALRYDSPVRESTHRWTREPVKIGDVEIPAGEIVFVSLQAANRDPTVFSAPEVLDITRPDLGGSSHLAFGHGIHRCLGAALGRLETEVALGGLTHRFPRAALAVAPDELQHRQGTVIVHSYAELHVLLDTARRPVPAST